MTTKLEIYNLETDEVVRTIDVAGMSQRTIERIVSGAFVNMGVDYNIREVE